MSIIIFFIYSMNTNWLIIVLLVCIIAMLLTQRHQVRPIIIPSYSTADIGVQSWNPVTHPYATNFHQPIHFGHHGRFR